MDFTNRPRETVDIPRATAEQALNALDLAQRILQSDRNLHHPEVRDAYNALRRAVRPLRPTPKG